MDADRAAACYCAGYCCCCLVEAFTLLPPGCASLVSLFQVASFLTDVLSYGRPVFATWNLVAYNVLGQGGDGQGSELYGVEPWTFYPKNLLLNYNLVAVLAVASLLVSLRGVFWHFLFVGLCGRGVALGIGHGVVGWLWVMASWVAHWVVFVLPA